jgi:hypothetical protein|tara:strand:+ start:13050 stop:14534 length:1485 start_codon:yes stop_codon:yes gene_type:complete
MKKYLIYSNTGLSSRQVGLTAEYLETLKSQDVELKIVMCDNVLENCYFNPVHNTLACASCQSRSRQLIKEIGIPKENIINLKQFSFEVELPFFDELDDLLNYEYERVNIGRGVASSVISYYRDYRVSSHKYDDIIKLECKKAINVLLNFKQIIEKENPEKVVLFNGRFSEIYPLLEYCKLIKLDYVSLESGAKNTYELFENSLPHSVIYRHKSMMKLWKNETDVSLRNKIAHDWYKKKRHGDDSIEISFTKYQTKNALPESFDFSKNNVLILNSSEDEMKVIEEYQTDLFYTQNEAINKLVSHFEGNETVHFYLRVHPNLGKVKNIQTEEVNQMDYKNLTVIGPNQLVDTYAIMDECDKSIVFGSTAGIEATYWGNASILLGKSFYYYLEDTCYKPNSYEELFELISTKQLTPKSQEACLPYGYYFSTYGIKTKYFDFDGLNNSTFKSKRIRKWNLMTVKYLFKYSTNISKWFVAYKALIGKRLNLKDIFRFKY